MTDAPIPMPIPLDIPPGISRDRTNYNSTRRWWDCNLMRFRGGNPETFGGWAVYTTSVFANYCRALRRFTVLAGNIYSVLGTSSKLYLEDGGALTDITPIRESGTLNGAIATTISSATVTITDVAHGLSEGDYFIFSGATAVGGILAATLNTSHQVVTVPTADSYTFTASTVATSTVSGGGGAAIAYTYLYPVGTDIPTFGTGWGVGPYGEEDWGDERTGTGELLQGGVRQWTLDNFGEDIIACVRGGSIFHWDATAPTTRATYLTAEAGASDVPTVATGIFVTDVDRHLVAYGANTLGSAVQDPLLIRWADQETINDWTPDTDVTAGSIRCEVGSHIVTAVQTSLETAIFTNAALYSFRYIGGSFIFSLNIVAPKTKIAGPNAACAVGEALYWMSRAGFHSYNGRYEDIECEIERYIREDVNWDMSDIITCGSNIADQEVIWFYPSGSSVTCDKYVVYNYGQQLFYFGTLERSVWIDDEFGGVPMAASIDGYLYQHETGVVDEDGEALEAYIESAPLELNEGDDFIFLNKLIPDITFIETGAEVTSPSVTMTLTARNSPGGAVFGDQAKTVTRSASGTVEEFTAWKSVRIRGRSFIFRVDNASAASWRLGRNRVWGRLDGKK
jgi:hypothetical protein